MLCERKKEEREQQLGPIFPHLAHEDVIRCCGIGAAASEKKVDRVFLSFLPSFRARKKEEEKSFSIFVPLLFFSIEGAFLTTQEERKQSRKVGMSGRWLRLERRRFPGPPEIRAKSRMDSDEESRKRRFSGGASTLSRVYNEFRGAR